MSPGRGEQAWRQAAPVRAASAVARGMVGSRGGHPGTAGSGPNRNRKEATRGGGGPSWDRGHCALRLEADGAPQEGARGPGRPLHRARLSPGGSQAGPREHAVWAAMPSGASLGGLTQGGLGRTQPPARCAGTYRRAEVAAARAALVLHHPAPVVLAQHQQGRPAGRAHELVLDHAVGAPAQLQPDGPGSGGRGASGGTRGRTHPRHCGAARQHPAPSLGYGPSLPAQRLVS